MRLPRPWVEMTNPERFEAYEALNRSLAREAIEIEDDLNDMLAKAGCSMRTRVSMRLLVDPNDDPRLP